MPHALNMTIPIKQDPETIKKLRDFEANFTTKYQAKMDQALRDSKLVHYARIVNINDKLPAGDHRV